MAKYGIELFQDMYLRLDLGTEILQMKLQTHIVAYSLHAKQPDVRMPNLKFRGNANKGECSTSRV